MINQAAPSPSPVAFVGRELPFDFAEYLAKARRMSRDAALSMLGETILTYQPDTEALRARRAELASELRDSAA